MGTLTLAVNSTGSYTPEADLWTTLPKALAEPRAVTRKRNKSIMAAVMASLRRADGRTTTERVKAAHMVMVRSARNPSGQAATRAYVEGYDAKAHFAKVDYHYEPARDYGEEDDHFLRHADAQMAASLELLMA